VSADERSEVGVAIPAFNAERWLAQNLDSVLTQTRPPDDVLVLDDGSTDGTVAVAEAFGAPVRVARQRNAGIGAARNRALELVRGTIVAFVDSDDMLTPSSLAVRLDALRRLPHVDVVWGHVRRFERTLDGAPVAFDEPMPSHTAGSILARRSALERVGPFAVEVRAAEGLDWLLRARELGLCELTLEEQVLWRRVHGENASLRYRDSIGEWAHVLKASLDRRRAAERRPPGASEGARGDRQAGREGGR
jgi:glycosyltransferase involved in cell wall biosynthesis